MSSTFTHAGVSKQNGDFKVRFANDELRVKVLIKNGHTDIDLMPLPNPMTKEDAVAFLVKIDFATRDGATNEAVKAAILAELDKRSEKPARAPKAPKAAKAPKTAKPSMEAIKAKVEAKKAVPAPTLTRAEIEAQLKDIEDAPY